MPNILCLMLNLFLKTNISKYQLGTTSFLQADNMHQNNPGVVDTYTIIIKIRWKVICERRVCLKTSALKQIDSWKTIDGICKSGIGSHVTIPEENRDSGVGLVITVFCLQNSPWAFKVLWISTELWDNLFI